MLIIEDEFLIALDLQDLLQSEGAMSVAIAETETEAIAFARAKRPDVITSDVALRHGTGPRAVETIMSELGRIPVIFITGMPDACTPCDASAHIFGKPLKYAEIAAAFHEIAPHRRG